MHQLEQQYAALNDSFKIQNSEVQQLRFDNRSLTVENTYLKNIKDPGVEKQLKSEASLTISIARSNATLRQLSLQTASHNEELKEARSRLFKQENIFILREESLLRQISHLTTPLSQTKIEYGVGVDVFHAKDEMITYRKSKKHLQRSQKSNGQASVHIG